MSEIKTKISTYNDVVDLFGEEKAADMLSEALDWSTIDPKNDKKNIMERKPLLLDPYMTYEGEDYCKHIVAGFLGDRDLDWASGYIDEEKIKNGQVMPADLKSALSMALDNELSTSWAYLDALSSQCAEIFNKFAGYIESAGLASGVLVPGEYELDSNALNAARTIREYESSIQRPKAERTINDSILSALLRGDELPEMDVKAIRQYGIQCSEYLDFGYDVDASLSGMLSPHAVLEPRPNTPYVFRRAGFDNLPFIYTQRHLRNAIAPKEADNHQHGLTIEQIKALPEKLEEPVVVFDQPNYTVNGRSFEGKGVAAVLDMYDPDGVPVIAYFFPNGYGTKTNDNGCSNVIASLYGRDNFTSYLARAANEEKILYIDSEKYEQMEKELPRYGGTRFPPALAALSMDIIIPSSYICKMKAEINPKLSDREREHNSLNRTMHIKVADSRRNRLAQDRDKLRNITLRYDDDNRDSQ